VKYVALSNPKSEEKIKAYWREEGSDSMVNKEYILWKQIFIRSD
jgi:hypothetical protein